MRQTHMALKKVQIIKLVSVVVCTWKCGTWAATTTFLGACYLCTAEANSIATW